MTEQRDTAELVKWLRLYARGLQISGEPTHGNDEGLNLAADRLETLESRQRVLREALEPFATIAIQAEQAWTSGHYYQPEDYVRPAIRLKHFITARRALAGDAG